MFSNDIHRLYEAVSQPVWMSHGLLGDFADFRGKALVRDRGNWTTTVYPTGALPYFEVPSAFHRALDDFLDGRTSNARADAPVASPHAAAPA